MVYELKDSSYESLANVLEIIKKRNKKNKKILVKQSLDGSEYQEAAQSEQKKKTLAHLYGSLIRGYDGLEYQKAARYGSDD